MEPEPIAVGELIDALGEFAEDAEVRLVHQPSWPLEYHLHPTPLVQTVLDEGGDSREVVYLVEGEQLGYLPGAARDRIGW